MGSFGNRLFIRDTEREINWMIGGQLVYNKNYISKLSEAVKAQNEAYLKEDVDVANLFYEGRPQNAIYAVRSFGIDPSTGKEVFLDKNARRRIFGMLLIKFIWVRRIRSTGGILTRCLCGRDLLLICHSVFIGAVRFTTRL